MANNENNTEPTDVTDAAETAETVDTTAALEELISPPKPKGVSPAGKAINAMFGG